MNWILALLAFAGLMTILSTIVYIIVEALHKGFSLRKAGLSEMLRSLHDHVITPMEQDDPSFVPTTKQTPKHSQNAVEFAKAVQQSPTYAGRQKWYSPSNWGLGLNQRKFENLNRRQLVEQLAQTEFGQALARKHRSRIEFALGRIAYEFDRFGEAQSAYFKRRAKVLSGIVAFLFVVVANVNVIDIYLYLARDDQALNATLSALDADNPEDFRRLQSNIEDNARKFTEQLEADNLTSQEAITAARDLQFYLTELQGGLNLPVGRDYFPYCADEMIDSGRCSIKETGDDGTAQLVSNPNSFELFGTMPIEGVPEPIARMAHNWQTGLYWIFCMIASAGLLALGAPFWFDLFNKTASYVGAVAAGRAVSGRENRKTEPAVADILKDDLKRSENPDVREMADALLIASGVSQSNLPPREVIGTKLGRSSAEATSDGPALGVSQAAMEYTSLPENKTAEPTPDARQSQADNAAVSTVTSPRASAIRGVRGNWKGR